MKSAELTGKQKRFVEEYLLDINATKAAIRAGYSAKTAEAIGWENLRKPEIQAAIQAAMQQRSERTQIDQDWVLKRLAVIADADIKNVASWGATGVSFKDSDELEWGAAYGIKKVKEHKVFRQSNGPDPDMIVDQKLELEQHDKLKALELIAKHLGMFTEKPAQADETELPDPDDVDLAGAMERIKRITEE